MHPEIQRRAQEEVDSVLGKNRLPSLHDRASMPYVENILKEVLRWGTVSPMGLFHCTAANDEYMEYHIPARSTVIPNIWAMTHDPAIYPNPFAFDPDRFHGQCEQPDPRSLAFGFGRRVCPGQHIGEASIFIQIASVLATLDISKATDESGKTIEPEVAFTSTIVRYFFSLSSRNVCGSPRSELSSHIKPFKCHITPRSEHAVELVQQALVTE